MAILNNLIVTGNARILNKLYVNDLDIPGEVAASAFKAGTAGFYINGNQAIYSNGNDNYLYINGNKAFSEGVNFGSSFVNMQKSRIQNELIVGPTSNDTPYLSVTSSRTDILSLHSDNASFDYITGRLGVFDNFTVQDVLRAYKYNLTEITALGGQFYVSPVLYFKANPTFTIDTFSEENNVLTIAAHIIDTSTITTDTIGGIQWTQNSKIKISGIFKKNSEEYSLKSIPGELSNRLNSDNGRLDFIFQINKSQFDEEEKNKIEIFFKVTNYTYSSTNIKDLAVMIYEKGNPSAIGTEDKTFPVGILLTGYGTNNASYIDMYNGETTRTKPALRLGYLNGLSNEIKINGISPTGWGLYSENVFLTGTIFATGGSIGGFTMETNTIHTTGLTVAQNIDGSIALSSDTNGFTRTIGGTSRGDLRFAIGSNFAVNKTGALYAYSGYIGCWNITQNALYSNGHSAYNTNANGIYMDDEYIAGGKQAQWYFKNDGSAKIGNMTLSANGVLSIPAAEITGLYTEGTTTIDGSKITTGSVTADQIATDAIRSKTYTYTSGNFSTTGTMFNLAGTGYIRSKNFAIDTSGNAYFKGNIEASSGIIGAYTIDENSLYSGEHSTWNSNVNGIYIGKIDINDNTSSDNYIISGGNHTSNTDQEPKWYLKSDGSAKFGKMTLSANGVLSIPAAEITGLYTEGTTTIDGGKITANSISSGQLATDAIQSSNYNYNEGLYSTAGTFFDLSQGGVISKNFAIDSSGNAYFNGEITAIAGRIGDCEIVNGKLKIGTSKSSRNLMINTMYPFTTAEKRPKTLYQTSNTTGLNLTAVEHGIKSTKTTSSYPSISFGTSTVGANMVVLAGKTYTLSFDWKAKVYSGDTTTTTRYIYVIFYSNKKDPTAYNVDGSNNIAVKDAQKGTEMSGHIDFTFDVDPTVTSSYIRIRTTTTVSQHLQDDYIELTNLMLVESDKADSWSPAPEDISVNNIYTTGTTTIDGGLITTGSVSADQIATDAIKSKNYSYSSGAYSTEGTFLNLVDGGIISKNFAIDSSGNAYFNGKINAWEGEIAGWSISSNALTKIQKDSNNQEISYIKIQAPTSIDPTVANSDVFVVRVPTTSNNQTVMTYPYILRADGSFIATSATILGNITATSGTIGGCSISNGVLQISEANITGTLSSNKIAANAITADKVAANAITADKVAANAITANKIATGTITADKIATNTLTATQIKIGDYNNLITVNENDSDSLIPDEAPLNGGVIISNGYLVKSVNYNNYMCLRRYTLNNFADNETLYYSIDIKGAASGTCTLSLWFYDKNYNYQAYFSSNTISFTTSNKTYTGSITLTNVSNYAYFVIGLVDTRDSKGQIYIKKATLYKKINGGLITGEIKSSNYSYSSGTFSTTGTYINLINGGIISKNFAIDTTGNAYLKGRIEAISGSFGNWEISTDKIYSNTIPNPIYNPDTDSYTNDIIYIDDISCNFQLSTSNYSAYLLGSQYNNIRMNLGESFGIDENGQVYAATLIMQKIQGVRNVSFTNSDWHYQNINYNQIYTLFGPGINQSKDILIVRRRKTTGDFDYPFFIRADGQVGLNELTSNGPDIVFRKPPVFLGILAKDSGLHLILDPVDGATLRYVSGSSKRYKDILRPLTSQDINQLYKIQPVLAKYKDDYLDPSCERYQKYVPMFVAEDIDIYYQAGVDHKNGLAEDWNYRYMIPAMFQMIKDLKQQIDQLKSAKGQN